MIKVGIPRALLYYQYFPMWKTFFESLGAQVVVSRLTTKAMVTAGVARTVSDTCLPVKVFCGHVLSLVGECDYLFIPSLRSIEPGVYNCSKFLGLPDVVRAVLPEAPPILDPDIDFSQGKRALYLAIYRLARPFTWNPLRVKRASELAWQAHLTYGDLMRRRHLRANQALACLLEGAAPGNDGDGPQSALKVALIGHPYLINDDYVNHRIVERLQNMGVRVMTGEMVEPAELDGAVARLVGRPYWTFEDEITGAGGFFLDGDADGVISMVAFGCGPDSVMMDVLQRYTKRQAHKPFMPLTIDEHTGEAGIVTRLEAFVDMLHRRKRSQCA